MRILMMTNTYVPIVGGVEKSIRSFTTHFREQGHEVHIVAPSFEGVPENESGILRIPAIQKFNHTDFSVNFPIPGLLERLMQDFKPDIVHSHHPFLLGDMALRLSGQYGLPLVFTYHTMYEQYLHYLPFHNDAIKRFVMELAVGYANLADQVIAPCRSVKDILQSRGVETPIKVVPTGIDVKKFETGNGEHFRNRFGIPAEAFVVGHVGRLAPEKNLEFLCLAVSKFLSRNNNSYFLIVGTGPSQEIMREIFRDQGLENRVIFAGVLKDNALVDSYHAMNVFAFSSYSETQGIVLAESMASGVPVVAIDSQGVRDIVRDGVNGRLIYAKNENEFEAALTWVKQKSNRDREMLKQESLKIAKNYSSVNSAQKVLDCYVDLKSQTMLSTKTNSNVWKTAMQRLRTEWSMAKNIANASEAAYSESAFVEKSSHKYVNKNGILLRCRRWLNKHEWTAGLLKLEKLNELESKSGLVLIQIDGLSKNHLENAIRKNEMPFLKGLLNNERYRLHPLYTGLPSSTPAVQGELFYGVKQIVPAFSYFDKENQQTFTMFDSKNVLTVEERLKNQGQGLLDGGSSYCNIYEGGARESHFCASSLGISRIWKDVNIFKMAILIFTHFLSIVRMIFLSVLELVLALIEFFHGVLLKNNILKELKFVPTRVVISILLRELITLGTKIDIARGLPIIHLNFVGYDEQAHRRGPSSRFAYWALKGIDLSIADIYKNAIRSSRRNYDVWIYSDHGQQDTISYQSQYGKTIQEAVSQAYETLLQNNLEFETVDQNYSKDSAGALNTSSNSHFFEEGHINYSEIRNLPIRRGVQYHRARYIGSRFIRDLLVGHDLNFNSAIKVTAIGPTGNIYLPEELDSDQKSRFARLLVESARVPLVLQPQENGTVFAWTKDGEFVIPDQAESILGKDHPYLKDVTDDLIRLCHHPSAGDYTISGWRINEKPISFPVENGAHAGPGVEETNAFALLPKDIVSFKENQVFLRTQDLRSYALKLLDRNSEDEKMDLDKVVLSNLQAKRIRILTYNVHSCVGMDGKTSPERIARVIAQHEPDIVALQELDMNRARTGAIDQPHIIAKYLEMMYHFHPSICVAEEQYGNAILSRFPIQVNFAGRLPMLPDKPNLEPRGAIWASINIDGNRIQVINTHLGLRSKEKLRQAEALLGEEWLGHHACTGPTILCGDFNSRPNSRVCQRLTENLKDAQSILENHQPHATWFSPYPLSRIDHLFVSSDIKVLRAEVSKTELDRLSSDHLPLIIDVAFS